MHYHYVPLSTGEGFFEKNCCESTILLDAKFDSFSGDVVASAIKYVDDKRNIGIKRRQWIENMKNVFLERIDLACFLSFILWRSGFICIRLSNISEMGSMKCRILGILTYTLQQNYRFDKFKERVVLSSSRNIVFFFSCDALSWILLLRDCWQNWSRLEKQKNEQKKGTVF
jgi:hypothetical protein